MRLVADASRAGNVLKLTPDDMWMSGAAWHSTKVPLSAGFETTFTFRITSSDSSFADGIAFVIQNQSVGALGGKGGDLGYGECAGLPTPGGIPNSLAVEIDTYPNSSINGGFLVDDPAGSHISVHTRGTSANSADELYSLGSTSSIPDVTDGQTHTVHITYAPGSLTVDLDGSKLVMPYTLTTGGQYANATAAPGLSLTNGTAWIGLTASTGISHSSHEILSWSYRPAQQ